MAVAAHNINVNFVHEINLNGTEAEKELLWWHHRLGHLFFRNIQFIMQTWVLSQNELHQSLQTTACQIFKPTKCASRQYGNQHQQRAPVKVTTTIKHWFGVLKAENLVPGQQVSVDHFDAKFLDYFLPAAEKTNSATRQGTFCGTEGILPAFAYNKV
jgi:hypothetical protein